MIAIRVTVVAAAVLALAGCGGHSHSPNAVGVNFAFAQSAGNAGNTVGTGIATFPDASSITVGVFDGAAVFAAGTPQQQTLVPGSGLGVFLVRHDKKGVLQWVKRAVGSGTTQVMGVVTHAAAAFSITGYFDGTVTFGQGEPNETTLTTSGNEDVFVARYTAGGTLVWARRVDGALGYEEATRISARADGSIAITGLYTADATFGPGDPNETTLPLATGPVAGFLACYAPDGTLRWATSFDSSGGTSGSGVAACSDGGFALCGSYAGNATFGAGELMQTLMSSVNASLDAFVARFDMDGNLMWARTGGDLGDDAGYGVTVVGGDLVRAVGVFGGSATFGSEGVPIALPGFGGTTDDFLVGYDDLGNLEWAKSFGGTGYDFATSIASYADGTFVVTGMVSGDADFGDGEPGEVLLSTAGVDDHEVYVARFQPDGSLDWIAVTAGVLGSDNEGTAIASCLDDTCVVTGYFIDAIQFGDGIQLFSHTGAVLGGVGEHDAFIARYNPNGHF